VRDCRKYTCHSVHHAHARMIRSEISGIAGDRPERGCVVDLGEGTCTSPMVTGTFTAFATGNSVVMVRVETTLCRLQPRPHPQILTALSGLLRLQLKLAPDWPTSAAPRQFAEMASRPHSLKLREVPGLCAGISFCWSSPSKASAAPRSTGMVKKHSAIRPSMTVQGGGKRRGVIFVPAHCVILTSPALRLLRRGGMPCIELRGPGLRNCCCCGSVRHVGCEGPATGD
jgi:hypothetical protein